jgi:hypothetical protein
MDRQTRIFNFHRLNKNGSYDSIRTGCFATVASARNEAELDDHKRDQVCNPYWASEISGARSHQASSTGSACQNKRA